MAACCLKFRLHGVVIIFVRCGAVRVALVFRRQQQEDEQDDAGGACQAEQVPPSRIAGIVQTAHAYGDTGHDVGGPPDEQHGKEDEKNTQWKGAGIVSRMVAEKAETGDENRQGNDGGRNEYIKEEEPPVLGP